jgi:hypothetical protein
MHLVPFQNHDGIVHFIRFGFSLREPSTVLKRVNRSKRHILSDEATANERENIWFSSFHGYMGAVLGPSLAYSTSTFILRTSIYSLRSFRTFGYSRNLLLKEKQRITTDKKTTPFFSF